MLGILFFLPVFLLAIIFMWIDPISWGQIFYFVVTGQDISLEIVSSLAEHPYWLVFEIFLIISAGISFLLFSSYSNFLFMRLARSYIERKPVEFMHNEYLSKNFIFKYAGIVSFIFALFLAPAIIIA